MLKQFCILVLETALLLPPSLDRHRDSSQVARSHHRAYLLYPRLCTPTGKTGVPKTTYADASKAKHARLADTLLQRLCALAVSTRTRQSG
jgi:hypothetical protein